MEGKKDISPLQEIINYQLKTINGMVLGNLTRKEEIARNSTVLKELTYVESRMEQYKKKQRDENN